MSYTAEISRINPGCFLFLVDQSGSMSGALGGQPGCYKHEQAADALNRTLSNIIQRCSQGEEIRKLLPHRRHHLRNHRNGRLRGHHALQRR